MITTQFGVVVKCFRSDNGKELFSSTMNSYFVKKGVIHESSCINTPLKNGLAERRIGYILATTALLFHAHMQKMYWGEAVLTAVYLMNRNPTKLLGHQSPVNMLNSKYLIVKLTSGLAARVFGCIAYVHLKSGRVDPRALKCVFVGYLERISVLSSTNKEILRFSSCDI